MEHDPPSGLASPDGPRLATSSTPASGPPGEQPMSVLPISPLVHQHALQPSLHFHVAPLA